MRPEDLIPAFLDELASLQLSREDRFKIQRIAKELTCPRYFDADAECKDNIEHWPSEDLDDLFTTLNDYCPPYCYFGATEGDGSDYGCWPSTDALEGDSDVYSSSDSPDGPAPNGQFFWLHINDHGNMTLYRRAGNRWIQVWGVV